MNEKECFALIGELYYSLRLLKAKVLELEDKLKDKEEKAALDGRESRTIN
jgi:hypothetical protein